jgi:SlyX protein
LSVPAAESSRLDLIEIKLAHLERTVAELNEVVVRQQRELEELTTRNEHLRQHLDALGSGPPVDAEGYERPPHYKKALRSVNTQASVFSKIRRSSNTDQFSA